MSGSRSKSGKMYKYVILGFICICHEAFANDTNKFNLLQKDPIKEISSVPTPAIAMQLVVADLTTLPEESRPWQRYIWFPEPDEKKIAAISFAVNTAVSKASTIVQPRKLFGGQLISYDLRLLAPREREYTELFNIWERLATEPYFHIVSDPSNLLPANAVAIESNPLDPVGSIRFKLNEELWYKSPAGRFFNWSGSEWVLSAELGVNQSAVTYGAHTNLVNATLVQGMTGVNASVVRYDYFLVKILSTLDGGLYYDLAGLRQMEAEAKQRKVSTQQVLLESLGADEQLVAKLRSDQRVAIFKSGVTGKPRRLDIFAGVGVRASSGTGFISITHDVSDDTQGQQFDPIRNLLDFQDDARELIAEKPNGLHVFALFDGKGQLQDSAPDNVVKDHTIPQPNTARLQSAISCIRCHGPEEGWRSFNNDVQTLLSGTLDVFDDLRGGFDVPDTLDRLAGLYSGNLSKPIRRARDDYSDAVFIATSGMSVPEVSSTVANIYREYYYDLVDAKKACYELGYKVPENQSLQQLRQILPPLRSDELGISPEDPIIGALKAGLAVQRYQWEQVYADAAFRVMQSQLSGQK